MMYHPQLFWLYHPSGHAINVEEKDREHDYADADEIRAEALALEEENLGNDLAAEEETRQNDYASADADWLSDEAAAHIASTTIDTVATDVKNAVQNAANAWLQMADDGVDAAKDLTDDFSNHWNSFVHSYLGAAASHATNVINEDRLAAKDIDSQLTALASGIAAEQHDLNLDGLSEWKAAALALSPLDDALVNAWAVLESAWSVLTAWFNHADTVAAPVSNVSVLSGHVDSGANVVGLFPLSGEPHAENSQSGTCPPMA